MTSLAKPASVPSLIRSPRARPPRSPIRDIGTSLPVSNRPQHGHRRRRAATPARASAASSPAKFDDQRLDARARARKRRKSACEIAVVAVLASGWKFTGSAAASAGVQHEAHPVVRIVDQGEGGHRAGRDAQRLLPVSSAEPNDSRAEPIAAGSAFRSILASCSAEISHSWPLASFRNRFLVWPPGSPALISIALAHPEHRRMLQRAMRDPQLSKRAKRSSRVCMKSDTHSSPPSSTGGRP